MVQLRLTNGKRSAAFRRLRVAKNRSRAIRPLCGFVAPHFASPANLRFAYSGLQNVVYLERCVPFVLKLHKYSYTNG